MTRTIIAAAAAVLAFATGASGQDASDRVPTEPASLDLGIAGVGVSFGNSPRWTGLRINWRDEHVQRVDGINLTLWTPRDNPDFTMNGIALGIVGPAVGTLNGIGAGLGGVFAESGINGVAIGGLGVVGGAPGIRGISIGGLGIVSEGGIRGAGLAGLGIVAEGGIRGASIAGLGIVSEGGIGGASVAGLGIVAEGGITGLSLAGLGIVAEHGISGLSAAGLGIVAERGITGVTAAGLGIVAEGGIRGGTLAGLGIVAEQGITGITAAGLGVVAQGGITGLTVAGLGIIAEAPIRGISIAGAGVIAPDTRIDGVALAGYRISAEHVNGVVASAILHRSHGQTGASIAGLNEVRGVQRGLQIGIYNYARELNGVQLGLLNYAANNRPPFRLLPLVNARFD